MTTTTTTTTKAANRCVGIVSELIFIARFFLSISLFICYLSKQKYWDKNEDDNRTGTHLSCDIPFALALIQKKSPYVCCILKTTISSGHSCVFGCRKTPAMFRNLLNRLNIILFSFFLFINGFFVCNAKQTNIHTRRTPIMVSARHFEICTNSRVDTLDCFHNN